MSFSSNVKNEICRSVVSNHCCIEAELAAITRTSGTIFLKGTSGISIEYTTENAAVARRIYSLLKDAYHDTVQVEVRKTNKLKKGNSYKIKFNGDSEELLRDMGLLNALEMNPFDLDSGIPFPMLEKECCKRAYIKGAFLGSGSISDPDKSYHLEFVNNNEKHAQDLSNLLTNYHLKVKIITRKNYFINYIKDSEQIVDLLNIIGAYNSLLEIENIRIIKDMRNNINRVINCETANLSKTVDAAVRQMHSIKIINRTIGLDKLPEHLKILAQLRFDNAEASLIELGQMLNPPLGKSGVNHRLRKIDAIASKILEEEKENNDH
ncbi:MAG: DNA-binding protein WhiA [Tissierellales bacterium]|nr:DNA-binding protein WhiA [Tissierellales bacterium]MBN2826945.1 DNA-binding protein WhiA [Tissierellales bacterium]